MLTGIQFIFRILRFFYFLTLPLFFLLYFDIFFLFALHKHECSRKKIFIMNFLCVSFCYCVFVIRTTKRPVPLEHCLFYSGELYKVCESETFMPQGLKAAKDAFKKKALTAVGGTGSYGRIGSYAGASATHDGHRSQRPEHSNRGKQNKHFGSQFQGSLPGTGGGNQKNGNGQNSWGSRRSDASLCLLLINKLSKKSLLPVC